MRAPARILRALLLAALLSSASAHARATLTITVRIPDVLLLAIPGPLTPSAPPQRLPDGRYIERLTAPPLHRLHPTTTLLLAFHPAPGTPNLDWRPGEGTERWRASAIPTALASAGTPQAAVPLTLQLRGYANTARAYRGTVVLTIARP